MEQPQKNLPPPPAPMKISPLPAGRKMNSRTAGRLAGIVVLLAILAFGALYVWGGELQKAGWPGKDAGGAAESPK